MFAFPLCENVSMQLTENTDKQKAEKFLRAAGMGDKLDKLPKGIDTQMLKVLYDDGVDLSGGEKQKMALARRCTKTPRWWCSTSRQRPWTPSRNTGCIRASTA